MTHILAEDWDAFVTAVRKGERPPDPMRIRSEWRDDGDPVP
jgi:hypothetical protein